MLVLCRNGVCNLGAALARAAVSHRVPVCDSIEVPMRVAHDCEEGEREMR